MNMPNKLIIACILSTLLSPVMAQTGEGNWKKGRIYYRMVCTACHKEMPSGSISPATKTKAEWSAYLDADSHAKGKDKVSYYVSKEYREKVKDTNRAAAKFIKDSEASLLADVKEFVIHGAKDSDSPARCN